MTRDELVAEFGDVQAKVAEYFSSLPLEELFRREGDAWAPVDDLRHVTRSMVLMTRGLSLPPGELADRFGSADGPTRDRAQIAALALAGLAAGGKAIPQLVPEPVGPTEQTEDYRQRCLVEWKEAATEYLTVLVAWNDEALDRFRLPHPFLGVFNLREWGHFNAFHALHHIRVAERRLGRGVGEGE